MPLTILQSQYLEKDKAIYHYLGGENKTLTESDEMLKDLYEELGAGIEKIEPHAEKKDATTEGITADKKKAKRAVAAFYAPICGRAFAFCSKATNGKEVLKADFDLTEAKIFAKKDEDIEPFVNKVNSKITEELLPLAEFAKTGITAARLLEGKAKKDAFTKYIGQADSEAGKITAADAEIEGILDELEETVVQIERTILEFKVSHPAYYNGFLAVNNIDNTNVKHTAVGGDVTKGGQPVVGAIVTITGSTKSDETDLLGRYDIVIVTPGLAEVVSTHPIHGELKKVVTLKKGRGLEVDFEY